MKTDFTPAQLADPLVARSEQVIRTCVHCGFCNATCPTYVLSGNELEGPRGRIYLMKAMLESDRAPSPALVKHVDSCLSCLACMTTCPSGVNYMHLADHARSYIEDRYPRPLADRVLRSLLAKTLPYPNRFRMALLAGRIGRTFGALFPKRIRAMLELLPRTSAPGAMPGATTVEKPKARVALLEGCVQQVLGKHINAATVRLLNRHRVDVVLPRGAGCCGALSLHLGMERDALAAARHNIDVWTRELESKGLDAIIINASGCGVAVKDYGHLFAADPDYAEKAARIAALCKDIAEYLAEIGIAPAAIATGQRVAYHSACSLQHGQQLSGQAEGLLQSVGFNVQAVPEGHLCCGSAGTYNILQPDTAGVLRDRKIANIERTRPYVIATGNIGCIAQLEKATEIPIVHTVELLDWATGGPKPFSLGGRSSR